MLIKELIWWVQWSSTRARTIAIAFCINDRNVRLLLYANDIVITADNIGVLQNMINRMEENCTLLGHEDKSIEMGKVVDWQRRSGGHIKNNSICAVCQTVQSFGAEVWGCRFFEEVDTLLTLFLKKA